MGRLFGTDGVRGVAGKDLTAELAAGLGRAGVTVLGRHGAGKPVLVVGRDPRASGVWLEEALVDGIRSAGGDVILTGVEPTPAIAYMTVDLGASAGVVISASHNPAEDNGIKFFSRDGRKLPDAIEDEIEAALGDPATDAAAGEARPAGDAMERYLDHLVDAALAPLGGMRVVVDCANGSASAVAPALLSRLGADVTALNAEPDGVNINDGCGALHPEVVAEAVVQLGADAGVSHDGDADRALFASADGAVIDGDQVLAASAIALHEAGELTGDTVVATVMSNIGLERAMREHGITLARTRVGDRYVAEEMDRGGAVLGGEQSGHVIFRRYATTGDGLLTAVRFLSLAAARGVGVGELASVMRRYPQVLVNVRVDDRDAVSASPTVAAAVRDAEEALGDGGRVLLRPSGTEPLVRVMVEAETKDEADRHARAIADVVSAA
ncbi:MAG TPA: phosphoglucosamine mutase [Actinomycetota bacterium]|jgi:phosphoglucosamine mutase|nr:phosphoglucosamine mutase [Actinomycetota bacterium]